MILGLDGLKLDGAFVVPLIDFIADFSGIAGPWEVRVRVSGSAAREALETWGTLPDLVEVTLDGIDE